MAVYNQLIGAADDDSGVKQPNSAGSNPIPNNLNANQANNATKPTNQNTPSPTNNTASNDGAPAPQGTEPADASGTSTVGAKIKGYNYSYRSTAKIQTNTGPGKRLNNPLASLSSYDYQLSLYAITPDATNEFIQSGRKNLRIFNPDNPTGGGAMLIAQSGGNNNKAQPRSPGFQFDYGIDNLTMRQAVSTKANGAPTANVTDFTFTITEPYGFSFLSNLRRVQDQIANYITTANGKVPANPLRSIYILGIRFTGYDGQGNVANQNTQITNIQSTSGPVTSLLDPGGSNSSVLFEQFYVISITDMKFKIDGKAVQYNITAVNASANTGFGTQYGITPEKYTVTGATVAEQLDGLFTSINKFYKDKLDKKLIGVANEYRLIYLGNTAAIETAKTVSQADLNKSQYPQSTAKTTADVNPKTENDSPKPKTDEKKLEIPPQYPIVSAINDIIKHSQYMETALNLVYDSTVENDPQLKNFNSKNNTNPKAFSWFNVSCQLTIKDWDPVISSWAYNIDYIIQPYNTPIVNSVFVSDGGNYYPGPHKRYKYWYTGENSEILTYEIELDTAYQQTGLTPNLGKQYADSLNSQGAIKPTASPGPAEVPIPPSLKSSMDKSGWLGLGGEAQNSVLTALYDPGSYAKGEITILGDPDFLCVEPRTSENTVYDQFYSHDTAGDPNFSGFTINPNGGQVFIEIDFKEAIDYALKSDLYPDTSGQGIMSINDSVLFWQYPTTTLQKQIQGVAYQLILIEHMFRDGKFTQKLSTTIAEFGSNGKYSQEEQQRANENLTAINERVAGAAMQPATSAAGNTPPVTQTPPTTNPAANNNGTQPTTKPQPTKDT